MEPYALEHVCGVIDKEMDLVNKMDLLLGLAAITPDFIKSWTVSGTLNKAPFLMGILLRAAETSLAKEKNKIKHPDAMCDIIMKQLSYQRSNRQTIEALHRCGLSMCFTSVMNNIAALADQCLKLAVNVGSGPHIFCYDNIQISTSIFVEQRGSSGPAKVTSGTFGVLYKVRNNGTPEKMELAPIMEHFQLHSFQSQLKVVIVRVLTTYSTKFRSYVKDPALQHVSRRPMPPGYKTEQFPIRVSTIEEATFFQLGFGLFHLCLNLVWALLHIHRGSLDQTGSLSYFFALLEKTRLGGDHPDYHTLLSALTQILDGILLNAWRTESVTESDYEPTALSIATAKGLVSNCWPDPDKDKAHQNLRLLT
ncbi:hypothetical protein H4582DRAFT_2112186 [Lactarius indigo]|nr:hypothetical protein H4582DRAFT_2112186 [Lactarius indigo]